ncbi:MAG: hypothetical protein DDT22_00401 [candidate division WS2 bacterium]|nr:hypothetical protein [Candidatus Lithacetigena glycinireducens]
MNIISQIIEQVIKKYDFEKKQKEAKFKEVWLDVVGDKLAKYSSLSKIKNKTFYVHCTNSTGIQELCLLKPQIIDKINEVSGEKVVEKIHFLMK